MTYETCKLFIALPCLNDVNGSQCLWIKSVNLLAWHKRLWVPKPLLLSQPHHPPPPVYTFPLAIKCGNSLVIQIDRDVSCYWTSVFAGPSTEMTFFYSFSTQILSILQNLDQVSLLTIFLIISVLFRSLFSAFLVFFPPETITVLFTPHLIIS